MKKTFTAPVSTPVRPSTKSVILLESARLFALSGYSTVSMRDIAAAANITAGTIYAHFESKLEILETMMDRCEDALRGFQRKLRSLAKSANSLEEMLREIFTRLLSASNPFAYYGLWCAMSTQFEFSCARRVYYDVFLQEGKTALKELLDTAIQRGLAAPFNTEGLASLLSSSVAMMMSIHTGHTNGFYPDFDLSGWYENQTLFLAENLDEMQAFHPGDDG